MSNIIKLDDVTPAEKTTGNIVKLVVAVLVAVFAFWQHDLLANVGRDLVTFANGLWHIGILAAVLLTVYFTVTSTMAKLAWRAFVNKLTSIVVDISPIGILEALKDEMVERQTSVDSAITNLTATQRNFEEQEKTKRKEWEQAMARAEVAQSPEEQNTFFQIAGRKENKVTQLTEMQQNVHEGLEALQEVQRRLKFEIINLTDETEELANDNDLAIQLSGAADAASGALDNAQMEKIRRMAAQNVKDKYSKSLAKIDSLMNATANMASAINADEAIFNKRGAEALTEMRKRQQQLGTSPAPKLIGAGSPTLTVGANKWANRVKSN